MPKEKPSLSSPEVEQEKLTYLKAIADVAEQELAKAAQAVDAIPNTRPFRTWEDPKKTSTHTSLDYARTQAQEFYEGREADFIAADDDESLVRAQQEREKREKLLAKQKLASLFPQDEAAVAHRQQELTMLKKEASDEYAKSQAKEKALRDSGANPLILRAAAEETQRAREEYLALIEDLEGK